MSNQDPRPVPPPPIPPPMCWRGAALGGATRYILLGTAAGGAVRFFPTQYVLGKRRTARSTPPETSAAGDPPRLARCTLA